MTNYRDSTFDGTLLLDEQKALLAQLVEAARRVPPQQRQKFGIVHSVLSPLARVMHPGWLSREPSVYDGDLDALANERMVTRTVESQILWIDVTPRGFSYYDHLQLTKGAAVVRLDAEVRSYLDASAFAARYPKAFTRWSDAERLLWNGESESQLTAIGHLCREAIQLFIDALAGKNNMGVSGDPSKTVARLRAVIKARNASEVIGAHLAALLEYAGTLFDLVQRQEHGALKEGEALVWEDGRRVVHLSLVVMTEIDRVLRAR